MRIAVLGKFYPEAFGLHISETLELMGHSVVCCTAGYQEGWVERLAGRFAGKVASTLYAQSDHLPRVRARRFEELSERLVASGALDLVLVTHDFLWPQEVASIKRRTGAMCAVWFPDHLATLGRGYLLNAPYDGLFFKDPFLVRNLSGVLHGRCFYLPECQNPLHHEVPQGGFSDPELAPYRCDLATVGNLHSYRIAVFSHLAEFDVKIWGQPPPFWLPAGGVRRMYQGRPLWGRERAMAFHAAKIVVNNLLYSEVWGVNVRTFEAAAAGAFQLVDWRPGLAQLFEENKELVCFHDTNDLKRKIRHYLHEDEARREIGIAGRERAHRDHTYRQRLELLIATLEGSADGFPLPDIRYA